MRRIVRAIRHRLSLGQPIDESSRGLLSWALAVERWKPRYLNNIEYLKRQSILEEVLEK